MSKKLNRMASINMLGVKLLVAGCILTLTTLSAHAGLLDDLGSALRGEAKNETAAPESTQSETETSPQNNARADRGLARANTASGKRVALVIGNGNYKYTDSLPRLTNPTHDAEDIAKALRGFGFDVIEKKNLNFEDMSSSIAEFGRKIANGDAALFYFAGHGLQVKGQNYLIPVNARIESESQVPFQSINVNQLLEEMDNGQSRANIVMLDACRNNPISGKFRSGATRGLASPTSQPKGTVIVYATDPGNVAADGNGRNGLFTAGLLTAFKGKDLSLSGVLTRASEEVERGSQQKQTPYVNGPMTLQKSFQFGQSTQLASLEPVPIPGPASVTPSPPREDGETALWNEAQKGGAREDYQAYLSQHPKGKYAALAKARLKKLDDEAARQAKQQREEAARQAVQQEQSAWDSANSTASEDSYQTYLDSYPKGRYAALAQGRIAKLRKEAAAAAARQAAQARAEAAQQEQVAWGNAITTATEAGYQDYLSQNPGGSHVAEAKHKITQLQSAKPQTSSLSAACVFPNSNTAAPGWVCNEPVEGVVVSAVGSAEKSAAGHDFMMAMAVTNARVQLTSQIKVQVAYLILQDAEKSGVGSREMVDKVTSSVSKHIVPSIVPSKEVKIYRRYHGPDGTLYVLVGLDKSELLKLTEAAVKASMKNDAALWQKFKAGK